MRRPVGERRCLINERVLATRVTFGVLAVCSVTSQAILGCSSGSSSDAAPVSAGGAAIQVVPASGGAVPVTTTGPTTGAGGTTSTAIATGGSTSRAPHDPSLFTWPESTPDGGATLCKPGHYVGTYQCDVHPPPAFAAFFPDGSTGYIVNGPVDLMLSQGQDGEFLTVSGGTLQSTAQSLFVLQATVVGQLDCRTGLFSGQLTDGQVSIPPFPPGGTFTGPLSASFAAGNSELSGTWNLIGGATFGGTSCSGPWNATYQGP
jgi:hypothetical protein